MLKFVELSINSCDDEYVVETEDEDDVFKLPGDKLVDTVDMMDEHDDDDEEEEEEYQLTC